MTNFATPSPRQLKWFGFLFAAVNVVFAFVFVRPTGVSQNVYLIWAAIVAGLVGLYYSLPGLQPTLFRGWIAITYPIGWLVTNLLLTIVFCTCIIPIGLVMKIVGYDPLDRRFTRQDASYWEKSPVDDDPGRCFKQY